MIETYGRIFDRYFYWFDHGINGDLPEGDALAINLSLRANTLIPTDFTETCSTTQKYIGGRGLRKTEEPEYEYWSRHPKNFPQ